jgi:hypothetical protein
MVDDVNAGFSLADLADIDVTEIEEVRFIDLPAGSYGFEVGNADLEEFEFEGERRFRAVFPLKIVEVKAVLEPNVDKEALIGKEHTEKLQVNPNLEQAEVLKSIGRIRAMVADMGLPNEGKLGDIVRNAKGHIFTAKIIKQADKTDKTRSWARLRLDPAKK